LVACAPDGRPELPRLLRRHGLTAAWRLCQARRWCPVQYVVFDLLYYRGHCLLRAPLAQRRAPGVLHAHVLDVRRHPGYRHPQKSPQFRPSAALVIYLQARRVPRRAKPTTGNQHGAMNSEYPPRRIQVEIVGHVWDCSADRL
jgi:hypothetical protein